MTTRFVTQASRLIIALGLAVGGASAQAQSQLLHSDHGFLAAYQLVELLVPDAASSSESGADFSSLERGIAGVRRSRADNTSVADSGTSSSPRKAQAAVLPEPQLDAVAVVTEPRREPSSATSEPAFHVERAGNQTRITFSNIDFDTGSFAIPIEAYTQLDEVGRALTLLMNTQPTMQFALEARTRGYGDSAVREELSMRRITAIKRFLVVRHTLDNDRLTLSRATTTNLSADADFSSVPDGGSLIQLVGLI